MIRIMPTPHHSKANFQQGKRDRGVPCRPLSTVSTSFSAVPEVQEAQLRKDRKRIGRSTEISIHIFGDLPTVGFKRVTRHLGLVFLFGTRDRFSPALGRFADPDRGPPPSSPGSGALCPRSCSDGLRPTAPLESSHVRRRPRLQVLVVSLGAGTHVFELDRNLGEFVLVRRCIKMPTRGMCGWLPGSRAGPEGSRAGDKAGCVGRCSGTPCRRRAGHESAEMIRFCDGGTPAAVSVARCPCRWTWRGPARLQDRQVEVSRLPGRSGPCASWCATPLTVSRVVVVVPLGPRTQIRARRQGGPTRSTRHESPTGPAA